MSRNLLTGDLRVQNAKSHGVLYHSIFYDGTFEGCELSSTGTTMTVGAGHFMVCGRLVQLPTDETIDIANPIQTGYVRLFATVDLTKTASKTECNQFVFEYDYSGTLGGFQALTQDDVNGSGQFYSKEFAVFELSGGAITSMVRSLGASRLKNTAAMVQVTLPSSGWFGGAQTVNVTGVTAVSNVAYGINAASANATVRAVYKAASMYCTAQGNGIMTFTCDGTVPTADIPMNIMIVG